MPIPGEPDHVDAERDTYADEVTEHHAEEERPGFAVKANAADAENAARTAAMEAEGKKVTGGLHKFDASEVDVNGGSGTADDFLDAFGF